MYSVRLINNLIDISIHSFVAIVFSALIYFKSGNLSYVFIFLSGSILIDLDHLVDHFLYFKKKFNLKDFFSSASLASGKVYVFLHAWELNIIIFVFGLILSSKELLFLAAGLTAHLVVDCVYNKKFLAYFLFYRIIKKFNAKIFHPELDLPV